MKKTLNSGFKIDRKYLINEFDINKPIYFYKHNYGFPLRKWDRFTNYLWYQAGERNHLWAKILYYPINKLENLYHRYICNYDR